MGCERIFWEIQEQIGEGEKLLRRFVRIAFFNGNATNIYVRVQYFEQVEKSVKL
jgi:hypothetical protein